MVGHHCGGENFQSIVKITVVYLCKGEIFHFQPFG